MPREPQVASRRFKLTVAYDGTAYAGWQVQPHNVSVQQKIEEALQTICGQKAKVHGSGRTDRGVHARAQVAHVDLATRLSPESLGRALNARLPADIRVLRVAVARPDFHARRSAVRKEYRYFVWNARTMLPDKRLYAAHVRHPLDHEQQGGTHRSLCAMPPVLHRQAEGDGHRRPHRQVPPALRHQVGDQGRSQARGRALVIA